MRLQGDVICSDPKSSPLMAESTNNAIICVFLLLERQVNSQIQVDINFVD